MCNSLRQVPVCIVPHLLDALSRNVHVVAVIASAGCPIYWILSPHVWNCFSLSIRCSCWPIHRLGNLYTASSLGTASCPAASFTSYPLRQLATGAGRCGATRVGAAVFV